MTNVPSTAELLLESLGAERALRDAVLGDLAEEFAMRTARDGSVAARRWYWRETLRATPHLLWSSMRHTTWADARRHVGIAASAYLLTLVSFALVMLSAFAVLYAAGITPSFYPFASSAGLPATFAIATGVSASIIGGYIAAWLNDRQPMTSALVFGLLPSVIDIGLGGAPIATLPLIFVFATTSGLLRVRQLAHRAHPPASLG